MSLYFCNNTVGLYRTGYPLLRFLHNLGIVSHTLIHGFTATSGISVFYKLKLLGDLVTRSLVLLRYLRCLEEYNNVSSKIYKRYCASHRSLLPTLCACKSQIPSLSYSTYPTLLNNTEADGRGSTPFNIVPVLHMNH